MRLGIASGKGGTGKTTIATNLARVTRGSACYVDCDVEAPNGHIFLKPHITEVIHAKTPIPKVNFFICDYCGKCREVCRFSAIAVLPTSVLVFEELCHGCGGCSIACPIDAIHEEFREVGIIEKGNSDNVSFISGRLHVGEPKPTPLVRAVKQEIPRDEFVVIDTSPGTSCPVISAIHDVDYCLLVTEPTPFGLNDLILAVEMVREVGVPCGVVINRDGIGTADVDDYCASEDLPILVRIPDDRRIAEAYSRGEMIVDAVPGMKDRFLDLFGEVLERKGSGKAHPQATRPDRGRG